MKKHQKSSTNGHVTKLFLESEFNDKGNRQIQKANSQQNLAAFLEETDSENKIILFPSQKRTNINVDKIVTIRRGTYL